MTDDVIVAERLVVRYRGKTALDGLDLRVPRGSVYAFLGDNGAGKTTTMKILTGLAPPDVGRAEILGLNCWSRAHELRHRVGYMPERPRFYDAAIDSRGLIEIQHLRVRRIAEQLRKTAPRDDRLE